MGFSRPRVSKDGTTRYTALYRNLKAQVRSAGTFSSERQADRAWQRAEARVAEGRLGDPRRGRQTFRRYVETDWLPNHELEVSTRQRYTYSINKHLMPEFGPMRMIDILPEQVRTWITTMKDKGATAGTIADTETILSAIFTTALNDQVIFLHPCKGIKTPTVPKKPRRIITPVQFDAIYQALPDADAQLLAETDIESGLRWGELTELRPKDLDAATRILTVSRAVVEVNPKFHPDGGRFLVKLYPKDEEYRRFKLSQQITDKLVAHIESESLGPNDLLFTLRQDRDAAPKLQVLVDPKTLGRTEPNAAGQTYQHGTKSGYVLGRCHCHHCRAAFAHYRAQRRAEGKDQPRQRRVRETDGHIPRDWFRKQVWKPALASAGIDFPVTMHGLRHAHASWLLAGGADLQVVKERLGHGSLRTTEKYLHTLPTADETALDALTKIRSRIQNANAQVGAR